MIKLYLSGVLALILAFSAYVNGQDSIFTHMTGIGKQSTDRPFADRARLKGVARSGGEVITYTLEKVYRTSDGGAAWADVTPDLRRGEVISSAAVSPSGSLEIVVGDEASRRITFLHSMDGIKWMRSSIDVEDVDLRTIHLEDAKLISSRDEITLEFRIQTGSNFEGKAVYFSKDGTSWQLRERQVNIRISDEPVEQAANEWKIVTEGSCAGYKSGCVQETRLIKNGEDRTPAPIANLAATAKAQAFEQATPQFAAVAPGGSTRISLNFGFDKCTVGTVAQMQTWWNNSPLHDANIYISGRNRGCSQTLLTASWVTQVSAMGWGLIPTIVGYQSPCTSSATSQKFSYDVVIAEQQGREEADIAAADATNLGLTTGSVLYYDMERYDETASTPGCRAASTAFLKGWTDRVNQLGYVSGTYGSPKNAQEDWLTLAPASRPHAIWMARWDNVPNVWTYVSFASFPTTEWNNHQRIKQWQAPHNETWGGVTFNIDGNVLDGPVAGPAIAKNKNADFDGDGKADISVLRPGTGTWFYIGSGSSLFNTVTFGEPGDIAVPGDYDGDGKTDMAVYRPSANTWYLRLKNTFRTRSFGAAGDIPVAADYDGDGRTDIAVFRPSTGQWFIAFSDSRGTFSVYNFGQDGDTPTPADMDGDGKADLAVFRSSNSTWYYLGSGSGGFQVVPFGESGDKPVAGDYDGDGSADIAVYRSSNNTWYSLQSTNGFQVRAFGETGDIPAPGDFDGDGVIDIAVFRPATGTWYLLQSQNGFTAREFGTSGDLPVPTAYLPQ